jgi:adenine-specific DNA-methyltransferase
MEKINPATPDLTAENVEKIAALFPDAVTESRDSDGNVVRAIDFDALKQDLSPDIVEGQRERYQFTWPGKKEAKLEARRPCSKTMRPCPEKSVDWDTTQNVYIEGDNLEALKIMRETYAGKVKLIYIDPPYNTGHDFIYDDDFAQTREDYDAESGDYDEEGGRLVANPESNGRFHSDWCSMMYPRLLLARDLLTQDGAIFISIDDNESANLRKICDEAFGADCFVADIAWQRNYSTRNDSKGVPSEVEHLLCYAKAPGWQPKRLARTEQMDAKYKNPDGDRAPWRSDNPFAPGAASHQGMVYAIQHPMTGEYLYPSNGRCWTFDQRQMLEIMNGWCPYELRDLHDEEARAQVCGISPSEVRVGVKSIVLSKSLDESKELASKVKEKGPWPRFYFTRSGMGGIARKTYLDSVGGRLATNLWPYSEVGHTDEAKKELKALFGGSAPFDTPKPVRLMRRVLDIACDSDSTVLDFFSGSATMAQAVQESNASDGGDRKFVLVQFPEKISGDFDTLCAVGEERIRRAGAKIKVEVEEANRQLKIGEDPKPVPDIGFRVLRIDSSNFNDAYAEPAEVSQRNIYDFVDNLKEDRTPEDLLFQVLPKFRIPYSARIERCDVEGKTVFDVNDGQLMACFDEDATVDVIERIAKAKPLYAVFRDASMADDATAANLEELFKTYSPDTIRRVI